MAQARPGTLALAGLVLLLGGWIGAMLFFTFVMTPAVFEIAPGEAGPLVGRTLAPLNLFGAAAGLALAAGARLCGAAPWLQALPLVLAALCITSHFGVSAALAEIRATPDWRADAALTERFGRLHRASVGLLGATLLGALVLLWGHARALAARR